MEWERISVVIPTYNEGNHIEYNLERIIDVLIEHVSFEMIIVDDGSTDDTLLRCKAVQNQYPEMIKILPLGSNQGKGCALKAGALVATAPVVVFYDADLEIPPEEIIRLVHIKKSNSLVAVVGRKRYRTKQTPLSRKIISFIFRMVCQLLWPSLPDTQTGLKAFDKQLLDQFLPVVKCQRFLFDLELLVLVRKLATIQEVSIQYQWKREENRISWIHLIRSLMEFTQILIYHRLLRRDPNKLQGKTQLAGHDIMQRSVSGKLLMLSWRDHGHPLAGGAEVYTRHILRQLAQKGYQITWFSASYPNAPAAEYVDGVRHIRHGNRFTVYIFAFFYYLRAKLQKFNFDVVIDQINTIGFFSPFYCRNRSIVMIHQLAREVWLYELPRWIGRIGYLMEPIYLRLYRHIPVITVSQDTKSDLLDMSFQGPFWIAYNGVHVRPVYSSKSENPSLVFLGRLNARSKRLEHALQVFRTVREVYPTASFYVIGKIDESAICAEEGVIYLGYVSEQKKTEILSKSWLLIATSVREGWGRMVLEAAACGTASVAYNVPGLREVVVNEATGLITPEDPNKMAEQVINLIREPMRLEQMGQNARQYASRFSWENAASTWDLAIKQVRHSIITPPTVAPPREGDVKA